MAEPLSPYLTPHTQGCVLNVQVTPNGKQSALIGPHENTLKIRLAAKPVEGAANAELIRFLSRLLNIPKSHLHILSGEAGRHKRVLLQGLTLQAAAKSLSIPYP